MAPIILLVDDDDSVRLILHTSLSSCGYSVVQAYDGDHALAEIAQLQAAGLQPDLVITDLQMPGMPGSDLCLRIKANTRTSDVPVMLISCAVDVRDRAKSAGADAYLTKPFDLDALYARVGALLERKNWKQNPYPINAVGSRVAAFA